MRMVPEGRGGSFRITLSSSSLRRSDEVSWASLELGWTRKTAGETLGLGARSCTPEPGLLPSCDGSRMSSETETLRPIGPRDGCLSASCPVKSGRGASHGDSLISRWRSSFVMPAFSARSSSRFVMKSPKPRRVTIGGGGGFGGGASGGKKGKKGGGKKGEGAVRELSKVPASSEVVIAVAPGEAQLRALQAHCEASGMDKLVIVLNARLEAEGGVELRDARSAEMVRYFIDGGEGGFDTSFCFLTQPLGVGSSEGAAGGGDPTILYRKFPEGWVLARKPTVGPPREILTRDGPRPTMDELRQAIDGDKGLLGALLG